MKKRLIESEQINEFKVGGLDISQISLIISNIILLLGVIFYNWKVSTILLIYYLETCVIAFYFIIKKIKYNKYKKINRFPREFIFTICLILLSYLIFILFIASIADARENNTLVLTKGHDSTQISGLNIFRLLNNSLYALIFSFIVLIINHGISFYTNFIKNKEYESIEIDDLKDRGNLFSKPVYKELSNRLIIVHLTILIGGMLILTLGSNVYLIIFLICLKTLFDLYSHNKIHLTPIFIKT